MGTFSQTYIKSKDLDTVLSAFRKLLRLSREKWLDDRKEWFYVVQHEDNPSSDRNKTIIASQNVSSDWVEIELDFGPNLYVYDEVLRRISKTLETDILLGYYQSTIGEGRLAKFKNGQLELSFYEKYYYYHDRHNGTVIDRIYIADNFGVSGSKMEALKNSRLNNNSSLIDHDFISEFYLSEGWTSDLNKPYFEWTYLHIEELL